MKTIFDEATRNELIDRINTVGETSSAQWGKMNVFQMLKHCTIWDEWILGRNNPKYKQEFLGKIFGRIALRNSTKDEKPISKNIPAGRDFIVKETEGDVERQKELWSEQIREYDRYSNPDFIHDFFGKMTIEQIGIIAFKHSDHHLRQFGA